MKTFIVFLAFIMVFTAFGISVNDMTRYKQINTGLKELAQEAASGGMLISETADESIKSVSLQGVIAYANMLLDNAEKTNGIFSGGSLNVYAEYANPVSTGAGIESHLAVKVTVRYTPHTPVFTIIGKNPEHIERSCVYEWVKMI